MISAGDTALYGLYKIRGEIINDSCVSRQIVENETTENGEPYCRHDNGDKLDYADIVAGMDIELWWPYEDKAKPPRYRKCRVIKCTVVNDPNRCGSPVTTVTRPRDFANMAKEELGISDAVLERFDFDAQLKEILLEEVTEDDDDKSNRCSPRMKKLFELRKRRDELTKMYDDRRRRHEKLEQLYPQFLNPLAK